jgi:hypothetical protein
LFLSLRKSRRCNSIAYTGMPETRLPCQFV